MGMKKPENMESLQPVDLKTVFITDGPKMHTIDGVSFSVPKGETFEIVSDSVSGKDTLIYASSIYENTQTLQCSLSPMILICVR
jgi:ABC-type dipeptide/oligopeptide/nickel transport system ATPase component